MKKVTLAALKPLKYVSNTLPALKLCIYFTFQDGENFVEQQDPGRGAAGEGYCCDEQ